MVEQNEAQERLVPPLQTIYFYITEGCNCNCRHCWISPKFESGGKGKWPHVEIELFKDIIEQAKPLGLGGVKLTGGEPLIHPEIDEILEYLAETDLRVTVETNGIELSSERATRIKACKSPFISISIDGADAETHDWVRGVDGCFDAALKGAKNLVNAGLRPQFIMSLMKRNADQVEALVKLAEEHGAGSVKFNLVTPTERGRQMQHAGETLSIEKLIELGKKVEGELQDSSSIRLVYSHPDAFKPLGTFFGKGSGRGRCGIFTILGVLGSGKYALCGIGESVPEMVFGDARTDRLEDIWNDNSVLREIREGLPSELKGVCERCLMKHTCLGTCVALNYYRHHDLFAPFWYCDEAYAAGLFPETRLIEDKVGK